MMRNNNSFFSASIVVLSSLLNYFFSEPSNQPEYIPLSCDLTIEAGADQVICLPGGTINLRGQVIGDYLFAEWNILDPVNSPNDLETSVVVDSTTAFVLTVAGVQEDNLITNGSFANGPVGFTSDYDDRTGGGVGAITDSGTFGIDDSPRDLHRRFARCDDHSITDDNMMIVNGSGNPDNVWCQVIDVNQDAQYAFSAWATSVETQNPAQLQFSINGTLLGSVFNSPGVECEWEQFYAVWAAEGASSAEICLANVNPTNAGNDFAIDDLAFQEICLFTDTVTVTVLNLQASWNGPVLFCQNDSIQSLADLTQSNSSEAGEWAIDGNSATEIDPANLLPGSHTITYNVVEGTCSASFTQMIQVEAAPNAGMPVNEAIVLCEGSISTLVLDDLIEGEDPDGVWSFTDGLQINNDTTEIIGLDALSPQILMASYAVSTGRSECLTDVTEILIVIQALPEANAGDSIAIDCLDNMASIGLPGNVDPTWVYDWSNLEGFPILDPNDAITEVTEPGTYTLTVTDTLGCSATDQVVVTSNISTLEAFGRYELNFCDQPNAGASIFIDSIVGGQPPYEFSRDGVNFSLNNTFAGFDSGTYEFVVRDANFCETTVSVDVPISAGFDASILGGQSGGPVSLSFGDSLALNLVISKPLEDIQSIEWVPAIEGCDGCLKPIVKPSATTTFRAIVTDVNGCVAEASITVELSLGRLLSVPDAFSPNDDGINDFLILYTGESVRQINSLKILDRWGDLLYEVNDYVSGNISLAWNGRAQNQKVPPGVYLYIAEIGLNNGEEVVAQGAVTVVY